MTSSDYQRGAVRPPTEEALLKRLAALERAFPAAKTHRDALRELGSQLVYVREVEEAYGVGEAWIALIRFSGAIENLFGFTREIALLYSPHRDLQVRTFAALPSVIASLPRQVTADVAAVTSPDPRQDQKLDDWSDVEFTAIPFPYDLTDQDQPQRVVLRAIEQRLFRRDLYAATGPVTGAAFFGRHLLLQSVVDDLRLQRAPAIFGLRKSGKTSLLKRVADTFDGEPNVIFLLRDLESLPSFPKEVVQPLLLDIRNDILGELRSRGMRTRELAELDETSDMLAFKRALQTLLRKAPELKLIIALDEVEYLCPPDKIGVETVEAQEIPQLFGVLRSLVQETSNFTFVLAGLASAVIEAGTLFGRHNPLFSWGKPYYLPPFSEEEASQLLLSLGHRMAIAWDEAAIEVVYAESGGHPFLLRDLASVVAQRLPLSPGQRTVNSGVVHRHLTAWRRSVAANVAEMLQHVRRYYPSEALMLAFLLEDPAGFLELVADDPQSVDHLLRLGLVREDAEGTVTASSLLDHMQPRKRQ